jgi:hypothetical protein
MYGEPTDAESECNARLFIGDNYGDGRATMRCQLPPDHAGPHREEFSRDGGPVTITWVADERERCDHGCGQWDHDHKRVIVLVTAHIDGSHGGAREIYRAQSGPWFSARIMDGRYEIKIAEVLPPDVLVTVALEQYSGPARSITAVVVDSVVHVLTCGADGRTMDADFRVEIARPSGCPRDADDHEFSDCAYCHPGEEAQPCATCGKPYYYEEGHKRHCPKEPFTCEICGESGVGPHAWPSGCPKEREALLARSVADEFAEDR